MIKVKKYIQVKNFDGRNVGVRPVDAYLNKDDISSVSMEFYEDGIYLIKMKTGETLRADIENEKDLL